MSAKQTFIPPTFSKFGKSVKDLFKKKYDFEHVTKNISKTDNGVTFETGGNISADFKGFIKAKYTDKTWGELESEVYTDPKTESKVLLRMKKLADGLTVTLGGSTLEKDKTFSKPVVSADVEYNQDYVASQLVTKTDFNATKMDATLAVGVDGLSLGGQVVVDASKGADVVDSNVGVEYSKADFTASVFTEKNLDIVNTTFFQTLSRDTQIGAQFRLELSGKQSRSLTVGFEHKLDIDTIVKAKAELPTGIVSTSIEHRLVNPKMLVGVATQFHVKDQPFTAKNFGLNITLGDF